MICRVPPSRRAAYQLDHEPHLARHSKRTSSALWRRPGGLGDYPAFPQSLRSGDGHQSVDRLAAGHRFCTGKVPRALVFPQPDQHRHGAAAGRRRAGSFCFLVAQRPARHVAPDLHASRHRHRADGHRRAGGDRPDRRRAPAARPASAPATARLRGFALPNGPRPMA